MRLLVVVTLFCVSPALKAEELPDRAPLAYQGQAGVWLRSDVFEHMSEDLFRFKPLQEKCHLLEQKLILKDAEIDVWRKADANSQQQVTLFKNAASDEKKRADDAVIAMNKWYRRPLVWFAVGAVAAVLTLELANQLIK